MKAIEVVFRLLEHSNILGESLDGISIAIIHLLLVSGLSPVPVISYVAIVLLLLCIPLTC